MAEFLLKLKKYLEISNKDVAVTLHEQIEDLLAKFSKSNSIDWDFWDLGVCLRKKHVHTGEEERKEEGFWKCLAKTLSDSSQFHPSWNGYCELVQPIQSSKSGDA